MKVEIPNIPEATQYYWLAWEYRKNIAAYQIWARLTRCKQPVVFELPGTLMVGKKVNSSGVTIACYVRPIYKLRTPGKCHCGCFCSPKVGNCAFCKHEGLKCVPTSEVLLQNSSSNLPKGWPLGLD